MVFTELLRQHLPEQSKQKSLALEWLTRRQRDSNVSWSTSYVESRFSRCLSGDPPAVRFFFGARDAAVTLLDVLAVPAAARDELLAAADRHIAHGPQHPPARMVIDLSRWSGTSAARALFDSVRTLVIDPGHVKPAVLVVTPTLYEVLPRTFDTIEWLRVEVTDAQPGDEPSRELLVDGALLVAPMCATDPAHWLAIDFDQAPGRLQLEPADGLARFARDGQLPLPAVEHDLAAVVGDLPPAGASLDNVGPIQRRQLMSRLRDETQAAKVNADPAVRLAMARALGIVATSTPLDRVEAELRAAVAGLGVATPVVTTLADVDQRLSRARRRPLGPVVLRVGDELHFINPSEGQAGLDHPQVRVHRIAAPTPEIARLRAAIAEWTIGDFEADPFLVNVLRRLDPDGRDLLAYLHARAWLLAAGVVNPVPGKPVDDWRASLLQMLAGMVPEAMLMVPNSPAVHESSFVAIEVPAWLATPIAEVDDDTEQRLRHVPSLLTSVPVGSRDGASQSQLKMADRYSGYGRTNVATRLVLPDSRAKEWTRPAGDSIDHTWLDAFEAFGREERDTTSRLMAVYLVAIKELPWEVAGRLLATTWLALRMAAQGGAAVRSVDGSITLHLGGGLAAVIRMTRTAEDHGEARAMLQCTPIFDHNRSLTGHSLSSCILAGVDRVRFEVPARVVLLSGHVRAEILFEASPLLFGGERMAATEAAVAQAEADAARRRAQDDDDD